MMVRNVFTSANNHTFDMYSVVFTVIYKTQSEHTRRRHFYILKISPVSFYSFASLWTYKYENRFLCVPIAPYHSNHFSFDMRHSTMLSVILASTQFVLLAGSPATVNNTHPAALHRATTPDQFAPDRRRWSDRAQPRTARYGDSVDVDTLDSPEISGGRNNRKSVGALLSRQVTAGSVEECLGHAEKVVSLEIMAARPDITRRDFVDEFSRRGLSGDAAERAYSFGRNQMRMTRVAPWLSEHILKRSELMPDQESKLVESIKSEARIKSLVLPYSLLLIVRQWYRYCIAPLLSGSAPLPCFMDRRGTNRFMRLSLPQIQLLLGDLLAEARSQLLPVHATTPHRARAGSPVGDAAADTADRPLTTSQNTILVLQIFADDPDISIEGFRSAMTRRGSTASVLEMKWYRSNMLRLVTVPRWLHGFILERATMMPDRIRELRDLVKLEVELKSLGKVDSIVQTLENWYQYCIAPLIAGSHDPLNPPFVPRSWGKQELMRLSTTQARLFFTDRLRKAIADAGSVVPEVTTTTTPVSHRSSRSPTAHVRSTMMKNQRVAKSSRDESVEMSEKEDGPSRPTKAMRVVDSSEPHAPANMQSLDVIESTSPSKVDSHETEDRSLDAPSSQSSPSNVGSHETEDRSLDAPSSDSSAGFDDWVPEPLVVDEALIGEFLNGEFLGSWLD